MNTLELAESLVPRGISSIVRADIVQEVAVAILDGSLLPESPSTKLKNIIYREYRRAGLLSHALLRLDKRSPITGKTILETHDLRLPICNIPEKRRAKVYPSAWYEEKGHQKGSFGRPRTWFYIDRIVVFRAYHAPEACGMGGGWAKYQCLSLHAVCPHCQHLMHRWSNHKGPDNSEVWTWTCRICDAHVAYRGVKTWADRAPSPIINGKRSHRRKA